jgi:signal transduction histidine kinase
MKKTDSFTDNPKQTILIVDDNPTNLLVIGNYLTERGFLVIAARNGEFGLHLAQEDHPDLVLLDILLPGIDGFEFCRRLKVDERTRDIPVIFMTVMTKTEDKVKGFEVGGVDYITKPFHRAEALARVTTHLHLRELTKTLADAKESLEIRVMERTAELAQANARLKDEIVEHKLAEEKICRLNQELEQRVRDRTTQLEAANKELETFAYSVSHDLRAPLRHISGFLGMLQDEAPKTTLDEKCQHYMDNISGETKRMGMLIDDLLSFSRMGRSEMSKVQVNLNELLKDVIQEFKLETDGRNIEWKISPLPLVTGDRAMLRMVLVNLISNALKFTRSRSPAEIEVGWQKDYEKEITLFVRDNGVGFDINYAYKLFGVFQRLHRADEFEGTGIGLANVCQIIKRHGGRTWAEGEVNHGATFYFSLPQTGMGE